MCGTGDDGAASFLLCSSCNDQIGHDTCVILEVRSQDYLIHMGTVAVAHCGSLLRRFASVRHTGAGRERQHLELRAHLQKAKSARNEPITDKAELRLHKELSRTPCHILSEYRKKDMLSAKGARWDKELKSWTTANINIVRDHRDVIIFLDGFIPPRCSSPAGHRFAAGTLSC